MAVGTKYHRWVQPCCVAAEAVRVEGGGRRRGSSVSASRGGECFLVKPQAWCESQMLVGDEEEEGFRLVVYWSLVGFSPSQYELLWFAVGCGVWSRLSGYWSEVGVAGCGRAAGERVAGCGRAAGEREEGE